MSLWFFRFTVTYNANIQAWSRILSYFTEANRMENSWFQHWGQQQFQSSCLYKNPWFVYPLPAHWSSVPQRLQQGCAPAAAEQNNSCDWENAELFPRWCYALSQLFFSWVTLLWSALTHLFSKQFLCVFSLLVSSLSLSSQWKDSSDSGVGKPHHCFSSPEVKPPHQIPQEPTQLFFTALSLCGSTTHPASQSWCSQQLSCYFI